MIIDYRPILTVLPVYIFLTWPLIPSFDLLSFKALHYYLCFFDILVKCHRSSVVCLRDRTGTENVSETENVLETKNVSETEKVLEYENYFISI